MSNTTSRSKSEPRRTPQRNRKPKGAETDRARVTATIENAGKPLDEAQLRKHLGIKQAKDRRDLNQLLQSLIREGVLVRNRRGFYASPRRMDLVAGEVIGHPDGYGFVTIEDGEDLWLSPRSMKEVMHGDRVMVRAAPKDRRGRQSGVVVELLEASKARIVGRFQLDHGVGFVVPDDRRIGHDIVIAPDEYNDAVDGDIVVADLTGHPLADGHASGRIVEILGDSMAPGMEIDIAIRKHDIPHEWPDGALELAEKLARPVSKSDIEDRVDLREYALVTIDGADARDFDDAVYAESRKNGWRLIVAIADVSHYVQPDSVLDNEALLRGNSTYFPRRVVPMLPEALSNGMCSLNPDEDRLCMYCDMEISRSGEILDYEFGEGVMRSRRRLTYDQVATLLGESAGAKGKRTKGTGARSKGAGKLKSELVALKGVFESLMNARTKRGALDLDMPEASIVLGENLRIESIGVRTRNVAHRIIEECMLAANVCTAEFLADYTKFGLYRVHEAPDNDSMDELKAFLLEFGVNMPRRREGAALLSLQRAVNGIRERPDLSSFLQVSVLRTMKQARYSTDNIGHFALGYEGYTHFTSPIRRYADLVVHRLVKAVVEGAPRDRLPDRPTLAAIADQCSTTERRADDATRDVERWLKAEFMSDRIGEDFDSVVSGVTGFGVFVQLRDYFVDGLIHISDLGRDYFHFDAERFRLVGEKSGQVYRPGTEIRVTLARVDLEEGKIDFVPAERDSRPSKGRKRGRRGKSSSSGSQKKATATDRRKKHKNRRDS